MSKISSVKRNIGRRIAGVTMPIQRRRIRWGRNWLCLCGSGKKYKHCCQGELDEITASDGNANVVGISSDVQKIIDDIRKTEKGRKNV